MNEISLRGNEANMGCTPKLERGKPVDSLSIEFEWHDGVWKQLFDKHVRFIQQDILRALASNKLVVYLSCPISSRGGSYFATNVEIANFTVQRLSAEWGPRFWFLNPAQYQMESTHGLGLIRMHAHDLELETKQQINVDQLLQSDPPVGGDYMRMWTKVLAEDDSGKNLGGRFSAFYFISPCDLRIFFAQTGAKHITAGVESYFGDKYATDSQFRDYFTPPSLTGSADVAKKAAAVEALKQQFLLYYAVRASAYFSKGSHDEWNIWRELNALRIAGAEGNGYGVGSQIAGYFEGLQIDPGAAESAISAGYAVTQAEPKKMVTQYTSASLTKTAPVTEAVKRLGEH
jgi:hypothetical protein